MKSESSVSGHHAGTVQLIPVSSVCAKSGIMNCDRGVDPLPGDSVLVLHWFPIELFPPALNLLDYLGRVSPGNVTCCSTSTAIAVNAAVGGVNMVRSGFPLRGRNRFIRLLMFLAFPLLCCWQAIRVRPGLVLYYEPHSALAAACVCLLHRKSRLFIHYHEYRELSHYNDRGNLLARVGLLLERRFLHRRACWISHTNESRCRLFLKDCPHIDCRKVRSLPNLPTRQWQTRARAVPRKQGTGLKMVYVGALSLTDTYIRELLEWIDGLQGEQIQLDIFAGATSPETAGFLQSWDKSWLRVHSRGVPYQQLPEILPHFDTGLILYRGTSLNYVHNAPNKLFEYLSCGLNVLYPQQMCGVQPWSRPAGNPWVRPLDFDNLAEVKAECVRGCHGTPAMFPLCSEDIYRPLLKNMGLTDATKIE